MTQLRTTTEITIQEGKPTPPVAQCLIDARAWLSDFDHWAQGIELVKSDADIWRSPIGSTCAIGAVHKVRPFNETVRYNAVHCLDAVSRGNIVNLNDGLTQTKRGHAAILRAFDRAIGLALERGI